MLSREEAIKNHREMWNLIADRIKKRKNVQHIDGLKKEYIYKHNKEAYCDCYLCQYCIDKVSEGERHERCKYCPLDWESRGDKDGFYQCLVNGDFKGYYGYARSTRNWEKQYLFCCKIANLKEREIEGENNV